MRTNTITDRLLIAWFRTSYMFGTLSPAGTLMKASIFSDDHAFPLRTAVRKPWSSSFAVGDWIAEPEWNRIRRNGETVKLEPRVMRLLATLAATPGRPLPRHELLDAVWPETAVNEEALSRAVSQLRRAFGDDPKTPRYLQTVHKGGYCLIAPITEAPDTEAPLVPPIEDWLNRRFALFAIAALTALAGAFLYIPAPSPQAPILRTLVPLTSDTGREIDPAVSPDGTRLVYLASVDDGYQFFVRRLAGGEPTRLTNNTLAKGHPTWAPDGRGFAFVAADGNRAAIYLQSLEGGEAVKLIELPSWSFGVDWSPDGRTLAYSDAAPGEPASIALLDIATKAVRPIALTTRSAGDVKPAFSPDGKSLAFIRNDPLGRQLIAVADLHGGGDAKVLAMPPQQLRGVDWAPGGQSLIFSAKSGRRFGLWRVGIGGGAPEAIPSESGDLFNPSVSRDGRIAVEEVEQDRDVWRTNLARAASAPAIRSTADDYDPAHSPDGKRLAFLSERSGSPEIWIQSATGQARRVTRLGGPEIRDVSWSADGARLAFAAEENGISSIYVVEAGGGLPVRLLRSSASYVPIGWTAGGDALFVLAPTGDNWRLQELDLAERKRRDLGGPTIRAAAAAVDGRSVFAVTAGEHKLLHIVPGKGIVRQFRLPPLPNLVSLLPSADALYLVEYALGTGVVHRLDLNSGAVSVAAHVDHFGGGALSLGPGGNSLFYTRAQETANDLAWTQL